MAVVRVATEDDIPRILELYRQLVLTTSQAEQQHSPSPDHYRRVFAQICATPGYELFVAEHGGEIVGTTALLIVPNLSHSGLPWAVIENVVVDSHHQQLGIGKVLMDYAVNRAREAGCYRVSLSSNKKRTEAHQFYLSVGFKDSSTGFSRYF